MDAEHEELDLCGQTLMPGLIDMHMHLRFGGQIGEPDPCNICFMAKDFTDFMLDNGYTTVRDCGDHCGMPVAALRKAVQEGKFQGPNIYTAGPTIQPTETGYNLPWAAPNHIYADNPMEMRHQVRYVLARGADFIKLYGSGSMMVEGAEPGTMILEEDEMREAVRIAERKGSYVAIHMHGAIGCEAAVRAGIRTIEHASFIQERCPARPGRQNGQGLVLTLAAIHGVGPITDPLRRSRVEESFECLRKVKDYQVLVGWGTDTFLEEYQEDPYLEFKLRKEKLGFSNEEILKQVTINSAKLMNQEYLFGSVKVGKQADLVVINGNPSEDLTVMYKKPAHVIKSGVLVR